MSALAAADVAQFIDFLANIETVLDDVKPTLQEDSTRWTRVFYAKRQASVIRQMLTRADASAVSADTAVSFRKIIPGSPRSVAQ